MLELAGVAKSFGGVRALEAVDLSVHEGTIFGLIGPNGSGKSTMVNLVTGVFPVSSGSISFRGEDITAVPTHRRVERGIARTFQNIRLFGTLSVWQNLWVAQNAPAHKQTGFARRWLSGARGGRRELEATLEFAGLAAKRDELAANLSFGEQRRLEVARALAARPALLLLDEPAAGMNAEEIRELDDRIRTLRDDGVTILLIEHHMELVMAVTDRVAVLNFGRKIAEGSPAEIQANPEVRAAYLGGEAQ